MVFVEIVEGPGALCLKVFRIESNSLVEIGGKSGACSLLMFPVSYGVYTLKEQTDHRRIEKSVSTCLV